MRIIAGQKKGHKLLSLAGKKTRPTTDYVKEAIFSIIYDCTDLRVLDLYAGSGALGFEALSRGAKSLELVDRSEKAVQVAVKNINKLHYEDKTKIHKQKVDTFLRTAANQFDLILLDPPYNSNYVNSTIAAIFEADILADDGIVVVEHAAQEMIQEAWLSKITKQKKYGDTVITILRR
ncbi:MAG: 16S rRNA (guanine(966)-N(2))-methyltransferase RsmD [Candidatus Cloacimonetes bacterium]|nr:16S rRNA (guanine(966)-N(2))-methyltransferase RsmD [Candidatus Cloacimonadota bacterium]